MISELLPPFLAIFLRSTILIAVGCLLACLIRFWKPHLTRPFLTAMFILLLLLPLFEICGWQLPILPAGEKQAGIQVSGAGLAAGSQLQPGHLLLLVYGAGLVFIAVRGGIRLWSLRTLLAAATPVHGQVLRLMQQVGKKLGMKRLPKLRQSNKTPVAFTHGLFRHGIILPAAHRSWKEEQVRIVLMHESAHILRRDNLLHAAALCATVLNWCNPLAWLAFRYYELYREEHCDMAVVRTGVDPVAYAECLLAFVPRKKTDQSAFASIAMSAHSFKRRLRAILTTPRPEPDTVAWLILLTFMAALSLPAVLGFSSPASAQLQDVTMVHQQYRDQASNRSFDRAASNLGDFFGNIFGNLADVSMETFEHAFSPDTFEPDFNKDDKRIRIVNKIKIVK